jgi:hypothetical protein
MFSNFQIIEQEVDFWLGQAILYYVAIIYKLFNNN